MIVDASIALKWGLREADAKQADKLFLQPDLAVPSMIWIEVGHVLTKYARQRVISQTNALAIWSDLMRTDVRIVDSTALLTPALELSLDLSAGFYDCVYLALAIAEDDVLVTADERFIRAITTAPALRGRVLRLADAA